MRLAFLIALVISGPTFLQAQVAVTADTLRLQSEEEIERLLEDVTQDAEDSELMDVIGRLLENPLDLNAATFEELQQIPGITPLLAYNIVLARQDRPFESVDDLRFVEGMTEELYARMYQFVQVAAPATIATQPLLSSISVRHRTIRDLQPRRGFLDGSFAGSPLKLYNRVVARSKDFAGGTPVTARPRRDQTMVEVGILTEKDAGERSLTDFIAGYADVRIAPLATRLIVGDYTVEAAEGLVFWRAIGFSKGSEVISSVRKGGRGIRPFLSTEENWYFRGVATEVAIGPLVVSGMYSRKPMHATINEEGVLTSFYTSGLFRTESETRRRNSSQHTLAGARVTYSPLMGMTIGASGYHQSFAHEVSRTGTFGFQGSSASVQGVDFAYTRRSFHFFSEVARSHTDAIAGVGGVIARPAPQLDVVLAGRWYPRDFISLHGYGFGESAGATQNEGGIYVAARLRPFRGLNVSTYFDQFVFPWRRGTLRFPSDGNDFLLLAEGRPTRRLSIMAQYRSRQRPATENTFDFFGRNVRQESLREQQNYRLTVEFTPSISFRWRTRFEHVAVAYPIGRTKEKGYLIFQDVRTYPLPRLLVDARVIAFETDSFDSRVYEFESDLRGTFSNPALFGKGIRWYVLFRYEVIRSVDVWLKYAQTIKDGVRSLGSGAAAIGGDLDNRLSVQVDVLL